MRAVGDALARRRQVAGVVFVATWKAPHQRRDVRHVTKLSRVGKPRAQHPAIQLRAGSSGKRPARLALGGTGRLADKVERRAPVALEGGSRLGDDALVLANPARAACRLELEKLLPIQI